MSQKAAPLWAAATLALVYRAYGFPLRTNSYNGTGVIMRPTELLVPTQAGLYCPLGAFYIDPVRPVARALVTHAHSDHARSGHEAVLATAETLDLMRLRYGEDFAGTTQAVGYGETVRLDGVSVTFHPAGHVLGSAQIAVVRGSIVMVVPSGRSDGAVARVKLAPRRDDASAGAAFTPTYGGEIIAVDRTTTRWEAMGANDVTIGGPGGSGTRTALSKARLVTRADRLVREAVALIAVAATIGPTGNSSDLWIEIEVPPDLDDATLDILIEIALEDRLYASSALGWPTSRGTQAAASGALGMGPDDPFQDIGPPPKNDPPAEADVKEYGSGFSGRAASLSLPARADTADPAPHKGRQMVCGRKRFRVFRHRCRVCCFAHS
jgi:hypothetical protein